MQAAQQDGVLRLCTKCKEDKSIDYFYPNRTRKDGYDHYCKECRKDTTNKRYCPTKQKQYKLDNRNAWLRFFQSHYGEIPHCEVCDSELSWMYGGKNNTVHWDHRYGTNECRQPCDWYISRPCSEKNIAKWLSFRFGILCHDCNRKLPTDNRLEWLQKATKYAKRAVL